MSGLGWGKTQPVFSLFGGLVKIRFYLKDPDGFYDAVREAAERIASEIVSPNAPVFDDQVVICEDDLWDELSNYVEYREYISLVYDTEDGTFSVVAR